MSAQQTWRKGSEMPLTSCSGEYPDMFRFLRILTKEWTHFLKWFRMSVFFSAISVMREMPVIRTPWFFSLSTVRVAGKKVSISSGSL